VAPLPDSQTLRADNEPNPTLYNVPVALFVDTSIHVLSLNESNVYLRYNPMADVEMSKYTAYGRQVELPLSDRALALQLVHVDELDTGEKVPAAQGAQSVKDVLKNPAEHCPLTITNSVANKKGRIVTRFRVFAFAFIPIH